MSRTHADNMDRFYSRKWDGHHGYWLDIYPPSAQVYAIGLVQGRNEVINSLVPNGIKTVLDIGCGVGDLMLLFSGKAAQVVGLDISETNVRMTKRNLATDGIGNGSALIGSAEELPFPDDYFDVVVIADVIEHVRGVAPALRECARVLRPGGVFICTTPRSLFQKLLQRMDSILRIPIKLLRILLGKKTQRVTNDLEEDPFERFLSVRSLRLALFQNGMTPLNYSQICFYPGPEGGGVLGYLLSKIYVRIGERRFLSLANILLVAFKQIERLEFLNQKQLWLCQKT